MNKGFTLLELSVVLAIIGLIIGGIAVGSNMIRTSKITNIAGELRYYENAFNAFKEKYQSLPGDMPDASDYWSSCTDVAGPPANPCDGNGNSSLISPTNNVSEGFRAWQHLGLAELLEGEYTGLFDASGSSEALVIGENTPTSKIDKAATYGFSQPTGIGVVLYLGIPDEDTIDDNLPSEVVLSPVETSNFDKKFDDGKPETGKVRATPGWELRYCADTGANEYYLDVDVVDISNTAYGANSGAGCVLIYSLD